MLAVNLPPRDPELLPGELIAGKYCVERVLGRGGMGVVLEARNLLLDERVAIKVLAAAPTPALEQRLLGEARALARVKSDHVVRVFDAGRLESGAPYIVMELLVGVPLSMVRQRCGRPSVADVVGWVLDACAGLSVAHRHGIVHRDLKPANLFLECRPGSAPRVKVLDFGIAKLPERDLAITTAGPIGSPVYMAPEQLANEPDLDARTDVWGLGVVLYELLTGRTPFPSCSLLDLALRLRDERHPSLSQLRPDVPIELARVVDRCLEKQREARWASAAELALALAPFRVLPPASLAARLALGVVPTIAPDAPPTFQSTPALASIDPASPTLLAPPHPSAPPTPPASCKRRPLRRRILCAALVLALTPARSARAPAEVPSPLDAHARADLEATPPSPPPSASSAVIACCTEHERARRQRLASNAERPQSGAVVVGRVPPSRAAPAASHAPAPRGRAARAPAARTAAAPASSVDASSVDATAAPAATAHRTLSTRNSRAPTSAALVSHHQPASALQTPIEGATTATRAPLDHQRELPAEATSTAEPTDLTGPLPIDRALSW